MRPSPRPALPPRPLTALLLALMLAWPAAQPWAQDVSAPPMGYVSAARLAEANDKLRQVQKALADEQAKARAAQDAAEKAQARATQAERAAADAAQAGKATPAQLDALRRERDNALEQAEQLRRELAQANDNARRLRAAADQAGAQANAAAAAAAELDKLRRQAQEQQATITSLRSQLAAKDRTLAAAASAATSPPANAPATAAAVPTVAPPAAQAAAPPAALPPDLTELTVPGCGDACPSFVLLPHLGPVTLGAGSSALRVHLAQRIAMSATETTVGQWKAFLADSGYRPEKTAETYCNWNDNDYASNNRLPVRCVNVADAEAYAAWFQRKYAGQLGVRVLGIGLPSEVEFEFAARGGRHADNYLWADGASDAEKCRHAQVGPCEGTAKPVRGRLKNGYHLYDMIGNVWEWTASPWRDQRSALPADGLEKAGVSGPRAVRGASFYDFDDGLALSNRFRSSPGFRNGYIGFRLVARIAP